jgi:co-chaperonin GroES (HSP10)
MISKTGKVVVRLHRLMDEFARREDGSQSILLADTRFDNHNKMTISGIVQVGTDAPDVNPVEDADRIMPRCRHYPTGYVGGGVFPVDIRKGDKVYFHYLCAEDRTSMERNHDGSWDCFMQVSDIFVIEREGKLIMNQNWCVGDEVVSTDLNLVDALGDKMEQKLKPAAGIELLKGFNLQSYVDEAIVRNIDPCRYRGLTLEVDPDDRLYLAKDATFPNVIQDKKRILFKQTDILAIWDKDVAKVTPVGENHLVRVEPEEYKSTVIHHTVITKAPEWATIVASGMYCKNGQVGDKIMFTRRFTRLLDKNYWLISDSEIQATLK